MLVAKRFSEFPAYRVGWDLEWSGEQSLGKKLYETVLKYKAYFIFAFCSSARRHLYSYEVILKKHFKLTE